MPPRKRPNYEQDGVAPLTWSNRALRFAFKVVRSLLWVLAAATFWGVTWQAAQTAANVAAFAAAIALITTIVGAEAVVKIWSA